MAIYSSENNCFFERKTHITPLRMEHAHYHNSHELYFLERGRMRYFIGDEIFVLEPGDMVFIPQLVFHKTDYGGQTDIERIRFSFDDDFVGHEFKIYINELKQKCFIRIPADNMPELKGIIKSIESEENKKQKNYQEMQRLCFLQMLILISRYCTTNTSHLTISEQTLQSVAKYISENCNLDLSLEDLSKKFAMSPSHLCRIFKKTIGIGLSEYINISRITMAEKLLRKNSKSITEVATECGFNDGNYFAAVFKKYKGITPKRYALSQTETKVSNPTPPETT